MSHRESPALRVMIAEDDDVLADLAMEILTAAGFEVCGTARTVQAGIALARACRPDLALIDVHLADGGLGTTLASSLRAIGPLGVLYATGGSGTTDLGASQLVLCKPYKMQCLVQAMRTVAAQAAAEEA